MMKKKRMTGEERKKRIIETAMKVFSKKGFQGAKTKGIAKAAGVSEAMIFKYFKNKNDLYNSIISTINSNMKDHPKEIGIQSQVSNLSTVLKKFVLHIIDHTEKDPGFIRLMLYSSLEERKIMNDFVRTHLSGAREAFTELIEKGIKRGEYRQLNPKLVFRIFEYLMSGYCIEQFVLEKNKPLDKEEVAETMVDIFLNGLKRHNWNKMGKQK
jgi:AcrR family transcriptional regulator